MEKCSFFRFFSLLPQFPISSLTLFQYRFLILGHLYIAFDESINIFPESGI